MRQLRNILSILLFTQLILQLDGQTCYIKLNDLTGYSTNEYNTILDTAACRLRSYLGLSNPSSFNVYDCGFYRINTYKVGGHEDIWQKNIQIAKSQSQYYVIFGRTIDEIGNTEIVVDFNLPPDTSNCVRSVVETKLRLNRALATDKLLKTVANREIAAMKLLSEKNCEICDNGLDDDGDGYVDCMDLDCINRTSSQNISRGNFRSNDVCYILSETCLSYIGSFEADVQNNNWLKEHQNILDWGLSFMSLNGCDKETGEFVNYAFNLIKSDPEIRPDRLGELYTLLKTQPVCPDFDLQIYSDLLNLQIPETIVQQLNSYGSCQTTMSTGLSVGSTSITYPCFGIQSIEDGSSTTVNTDYYAVEITKMPDTNNDHKPDSKEELYAKFREQFTTLASGSLLINETNCPQPFGPLNSSWKFEPYEPIDLAKWKAKVIGSRFFIDATVKNAFQNLLADKGAIITIQENNLDFIISTIYTPKSGTQPFAGKRQWGIRTNQNGICEIFTRAIDRALSIPFIQAVSLIKSNCDEKDYFEIAHLTWTNYQDNVFDFIKFWGGESVKKMPKHPHPNFKDLYAKLKSNTPITSLSCQ